MECDPNTDITPKLNQGGRQMQEQQRQKTSAGRHYRETANLRVPLEGTMNSTMQPQQSVPVVDWKHLQHSLCYSVRLSGYLSVWE